MILINTKLKVLGCMAILVTASALLLSAQAVSPKTVPIREQLVNLQKETGLTMGVFTKGAQIVNFAHPPYPETENLPPPAGRSQNGALSPHGTKIAFDWSYPHSIDSRLATVQRDGSDLREYPEIRRPDTFCWSPDESKLVISSLDSKSVNLSHGRLYLLDMSSGKAESITDQQAYVTPQCWSPDGKQIVYGLERGFAKQDKVFQPTGSAVVYDVLQKKSINLGRGIYPTWSPDGKWIALYEQNTYYLVPPSGGERKRLFAVKNGTTGLLWSPKSLFVAYGVCCHYYMFEGTGVRVHVRRLADNVDDWVTEISHILEDRTFNWIEPPPGSRASEKPPRMPYIGNM